jgi:hypothetical protein
VHYTRWGKAFLSPCGVCPGSTVHIVTASVCGARGSVRTCSLMRVDHQHPCLHNDLATPLRSVAYTME